MPKRRFWNPLKTKKKQRNSALATRNRSQKNAETLLLETIQNKEKKLPQARQTFVQRKTWKPASHQTKPMKNVLGTRMRPLEPIKNKALVTVAGSLQEKHARGADGEAVPKTTTNHRYVKSIVDTKVAFGDTLAKPSNSNLTAAHSSKLLGALPLGKGSADNWLDHPWW